MASYLNMVHIQSNRRAMSLLRLSSHRLRIERGRWLKIIKDNKLCAVCHVLEEEFHVICICPRYTDIRNSVIKPYYIMRPGMTKLSHLLNTENVKEMSDLALFIKSLLVIYNAYLFNYMYINYVFLSINVSSIVLCSFIHCHYIPLFPFDA